MLEQVHRHILSDLQQTAWTDTLSVVTAVLFNLAALIINSVMAVGARNDLTSNIAFGVILVLTIIINVLAISSLLIGSRSRSRLTKSLIAMYKDNNVSQYYSAAELLGSMLRYLIFTAVTCCLALIAIMVPLIFRFVVSPGAR